jgi:hypothetical protein
MTLSRRSFLKGLTALGVTIPVLPGWSEFQGWRKREFEKRLSELKFKYFINLPGGPDDPPPIHQFSIFGVKATYIPPDRDPRKGHQWGLYRVLSRDEELYFVKMEPAIVQAHLLYFEKGGFELSPLGATAREYHDTLVRMSLPWWKRMLI